MRHSVAALPATALSTPAETSAATHEAATPEGAEASSSRFAVREVDVSLGGHKVRDPGNNNWRGAPGVHVSSQLTVGLAQPKTTTVFGSTVTRDSSARFRIDAGREGITRLDASATPVDLFRQVTPDGTGFGVNVEMGLGRYATLYDVSATTATHVYGRFAHAFGRTDQFRISAEGKTGFGVDHTRSDLGNFTRSIHSSGYALGFAGDTSKGRFSGRLYRTNQRNAATGNHRHAMAGLEARFEPAGRNTFYACNIEKDSYSTTGRYGPTYAKDSAYSCGGGVSFR